MASSFQETENRRDRPSSSVDLGSLAVSFKEFLLHPTMIGSGFPATRWMVERVLRPLDWRNIRVFVEYGPGTGHFTRAILDRLSPAAVLVAMETNESFVRLLHETIRDDRLRTVHASAGDISEVIEKLGLGPVDCILSGLPFSTLDPWQAEEIMDASCSVLSADGQFVAYQMRTKIIELLNERFANVTKDYEWRNIPPCHLYWAGDMRR